jgi:hypothetical protein
MKKSGLLFYEIMNYPIPTNWEYFSTEKINIEKIFPNHDFSRKDKELLVEDYCEFIKSHEKIFKSIPWIKNIYICNSLTFNKLNDKSDIDLFIVTKK